MSKPIPSELNQILQALPKDSSLSSLEFWNMGWMAHLSIETKKFYLVSDRGYVDVYEIVDEQKKHILAPEDQRLSITPSQIIALLIKHIS